MRVWPDDFHFTRKANVHKDIDQERPWCVIEWRRRATGPEFAVAAVYDTHQEAIREATAQMRAGYVSAEQCEWTGEIGMHWDAVKRELELSERNIAVLQLKLADPLSARMIRTGCGRIIVRAIEDADRVDSEVAAALSEGVVTVTASELEVLLSIGAAVKVGVVTVISVSDDRHYSDRPPGPMYMPTKGDIL